MTADPTNLRNFVQALEGKNFRRALRSYGHELVLALGDSILAPWFDEELSEFMLFTRTTPWVVQSEDGTLRAHSRGLSRRQLQSINDMLRGTTVSSIRFLTDVLGVTLTFSNAARFCVWPSATTVASEGSHELWELSTPCGVSIVASPALGLAMVRDGDPFVSSQQCLDVSTIVPSTRDEVMSVVRRAVARLGYQLFEPRMRRMIGGVDAIVLSPCGELITIEVATSDQPGIHIVRRTGPRLLVYNSDAAPDVGDQARDASAHLRLSMRDATPDRLAEVFCELGKRPDSPA